MIGRVALVVPVVALVVDRLDDVITADGELVPGELIVTEANTADALAAHTLMLDLVLSYLAAIIDTLLVMAELLTALAAA